MAKFHITCLNFILQNALKTIVSATVSAEICLITGWCLIILFDYLGVAL